MLHITITNVEISPTLVFNMCWWGWSCIWICSHHITIVINIVFCISLWLPLIHSFMSLPPIFIPSRQMSEECYDKVFLLRTIDFSPLPWMGVFHWLARCDRCLISAYSDILKWAWISRVMWSCVIKNKKMELLPGLFWWQSGRGRSPWGHRPSHSYHPSDDGMMEWICVDETLFICSVVI